MRPLEVSDETALLKLWNRSAEFDPLNLQLLREKIWGDPDYRADCALFCEDGFCMGVSRNQLAYIKLLIVVPEARRQGLGAQLLTAVEDRLGGERTRVCESHPNYLQPGIDIRYTPGLLFFEKHGYVRVGETYNLYCDLHGRDFSCLTPSGVEVRRAEPCDLAQTLQLVNQHFPGWRFEVERMFANQPASLHLAFRDGELLGFAGYDGNNLGTGWFGPMGTAPDQRGLGLGRILLRRCLTDLQGQGLETCTIPWVGPYGFYARHCGARMDRVFWRYEKVKPQGMPADVGKDER